VFLNSSCACFVRNVIWPGNAPPATDWSAPIVSGEQLQHQQQQQQQFPSWHMPQPEHFSPFPARDAWNTFHNSPNFNGLPVYSGEWENQIRKLFLYASGFLIQRWKSQFWRKSRDFVSCRVNSHGFLSGL
jgi:hypothetical protein